jgi:hypothetical protein
MLLEMQQAREDIADKAKTKRRRSNAH